MKIGILMCGHFTDEIKARYGTYRDLYADMLGEGFECTPYVVVDGAFPDSITEEDGWLVSGSRSGAYEDHPWNLNNFPKAFNSLMQFPRRHDISGINIPWLYIGMRYSTFCWHYEDLMLYSINYSHWGQPKQWYSVPESNREKFEKAVK